jgi:hypothetical protein
MLHPPNTVVAIFDSRGQAEAAIDQLWHSGFRHDQIGILMPSGHVVEAKTKTEKTEEKAAAGAVAGAVAGGATGALAGALVVGIVPGVGSVLAGGILTGIVLGGAAGAAAGSYLGPFIALGLTQDEAQRYQHQVKEGRTVVTVKAGNRTAEAITLLHSHGGYSLPAESYAHMA